MKKNAMELVWLTGWYDGVTDGLCIFHHSVWTIKMVETPAMWGRKKRIYKLTQLNRKQAVVERREIVEQMNATYGEKIARSGKPVCTVNRVNYKRVISLLRSIIGQGKSKVKYVVLSDW